MRVKVIVCKIHQNKINISDCTFKKIASTDCPKVIRSLPTCNSCMDVGALCDAPSQWRTNSNCGQYNVFVCTRGAKTNF